MTRSELGSAPIASEVTPLLAEVDPRPITPDTVDESEQDLNGSRHKDDDDTPLPLGQIALLCYSRLIDPIAFFGIFPFVNKMIQEIGDLDEADVGFYSGLIESLFSFTQMIVMIWWGRAADRFGRKPVMLVSLCGSTVAVALFGFSTSIWQMVVFRCLAGVFAGTIVLVRAMIAENSTPKTQAQAFSYFAFTGNLGIFLGPLIGGAFANPVDQLPMVFGNFQLFKDHPYALSTIVAGSFAATAAILNFFFLKETLEKKEPGAAVQPPMTSWQLLKAPGVLLVLVIYCYVIFQALWYTAVSPVFWFTSVKLGGFGFSPRLISIFLAISGGSQAIWLLLVFPRIQRRFGTGNVVRGCAIAWPFFFAFPPFLNQLLRHKYVVPFYIIGFTLQAIGSGVAMAFTGVQLMINDIAPSPATLGTLNALALTLVAAGRSVIPGAFASFYAFSVRNQILGGYLIWLVLVIVALPLNLVLRLTPEKAEGRPKGSEELVR